MPYPTVILDCPNCGAQVQHHVGPPQNAPWLCRKCWRGWWTAELTAEARQAWRPHEQDHLGAGLEVHQRVHDARVAEHDSAQARRTSARPDHLPFLTATQLAALVSLLTAQAAFHPECATFLTLVQAAQVTAK